MLDTAQLDTAQLDAAAATARQRGDTLASTGDGADPAAGGTVSVSERRPVEHGSCLVRR